MYLLWLVLYHFVVFRLRLAFNVIKYVPEVNRRAHARQLTAEEEEEKGLEGRNKCSSESKNNIMW